MQRQRSRHASRRDLDAGDCDSGRREAAPKTEMPPSKRKTNGKANRAKASQVQAATARRLSQSLRLFEDDVEDAEPLERRLDDIITTKADFRVAGFGNVRGTTTHLVNALLGKKIQVNNSAWSGYTEGKSACVIDAYVRKLD